MILDNENCLCPVCNGAVRLLDVVDFNQTVLESLAKTLSGKPIYYVVCDQCDFCFAPEICRWTLDEFSELIYNDEYILFDPDHLESRPRANAKALVAIFENLPASVRHLDYGGGNGMLTKCLRESHWESFSYDPFFDRNLQCSDLGNFQIITAMEVFEHVPDVGELMSNLCALRAADGIVLFSTLLSDGKIKRNQRLNWRYAAPRNGHISLFSGRSLELLAEKNGLNFGSLSPNLHVLWDKVPPWASHLFSQD